MVTCHGFANGSIDLDVSPALAPHTFDWSNGVSQAYNSNLSPATYEVTVTDARPCTSTQAYVITEPELLVSNYTLESVSCAGLADGQINASAIGGNGGYTYQIGPEANTSGHFNNLSAGSYVLMVTDSLGCAAASQTIQIAEPVALSLNLNATNASGSGTLDGTAAATVSGGVSPYQYAWSGVTNQTDSMAVYLDGGWYTVVVTDANGCSISDSIFVDVLGLNIAPETNLEVYPNPSNGVFKLSLAVEKLEVFDLQGRHISHFDAAQEFDLSHLSSGSYQFVCTIDKRTQILQVVKQ
jgi:hypothetical protein